MWHKLIRVTPVFFSVVLFGFACSKGDRGAESNLRNVSYQQAVEMINSDNPPVVIDVRTPEEFDGELGHIPGARLIPMQNTEDSLNVYRSFDGRDILLVCRSGRRSGIVGKELVDAGFPNVFNLKGGMKDWNKNGGTVERNGR